MADWFYYDYSGTKVGPISGGELLQLAKHGTVIPETLVEDPGGRVLSAVNVKGMKFPEKIQSPEPNPFTAVPPIVKNPFTAPLPEDNSEPDDEEEKDRISLWVPIVGVLLVSAVCVIGWWVIFPDPLNEIVKQGLNKDVIPNNSLAITSLDTKWSDKSTGSAEFTMKSKATENLYQLDVDRKIALQKLGITDTHEAEFDVAMRKYRGLQPSYQNNLRMPKDLSLLRFYDVLTPMSDEVTLSGSVKLTKDSDKKWQIVEFLVAPFSYDGKSFYGEEFKPGSKLGEDEHRLDASKTKDAVNAIIQDRKAFATEVDMAVLQQQKAIDDENARRTAKEREDQERKLAEAAEQERQRQAALKENFSKLRGLTYEGTFTFTLSGTTLNDRVRVVFENNTSATQDTINGKITFIGAQSSLERPFTVTLNPDEGAEFSVTGIIDNSKLPFRTLDELIRGEIGPRWPSQGERNYYNAPFTLITSYRNIGIQFTNVMTFSLLDDFESSIRLNISSRQATTFKNLTQFNLPPGQTIGSGGDPTPIVAVSLKKEVQESGFVERYDNYMTSVRRYVQYGGSRNLQAELNEANRVLSVTRRIDVAEYAAAEKNVNDVKAKIEVAREVIAKRIFADEYEYQPNIGNVTGNIGNLDMNFSNLGFNSSKAIDILFPLQDIKVTKNRFSSDNLYLTISSDAAKIKELLDNSRYYRLKVWFTDLRFTGDYSTPSADVQKAEIIRIR